MAATLSQVLIAGNDATQKNIDNLNQLKVDTITNNSGTSLDINTTGAKAITITSSRDLSLAATSGKISLTSSAGMNLNNNLGIGAGANFSATSPINCIIYPIYPDQAAAISAGLINGDHYLVNQSGTYILAVVHIP